MPQQLSLFDKRYFKIGEVSDLLGVRPSVLRFWESEFPQVRPRRTRKGQRVYSEDDIVTLKNIKMLLYDEKYTIPGARAALTQEEPSSVPQSNPDRSVSLGEVVNELREIRKILE
ncbi:MAG: MerR family transcriptional regulator [Desulfatibacillaceae bacterium]